VRLRADTISVGAFADRLRHGRDRFNFDFRKPAMSETLFSKIIRREIPADIVFEDEHVLAFRDINPQAPVHVLFIPKQAVATLDDLTPDQAELVGRLLLAAAAYARREGFAEAGYRTVFNCNRDGGQTVFHLHLHLLAGRALGWPPG
jgi:histidine triad (HIT) family protein